MTPIHRLQWAKCRHAQNAADETCRLPPGVMVCPCLGRQQGEDKSPLPAASLRVDEGGQIVWCALDDTGPTAWYTLIATRERDGRGEALLFQTANELQPQKLPGGYGFELTSRERERFVVLLAEILEAGVSGVEYVRAHPASGA
ncbi:MAG: hypothetical protein U0324_36920 [Polyangiales bacterium]